MPETTAMPSGETTNIEVKTVTWRFLNAKKQPGDSFDDILQRELGIGEGGMDEPDESDEEGSEPASESDRTRVELPRDKMPQAIDDADAAAAIDATLRFIAEEPAEFSTIVETVGREHPLGYEVTKVENRDGPWWKRIVKPGIKANGAEHHAGRGWGVDE